MVPLKNCNPAMVDNLVVSDRRPPMTETAAAQEALSPKECSSPLAAAAGVRIIVIEGSTVGRSGGAWQSAPPGGPMTCGQLDLASCLIIVGERGFVFVYTPFIHRTNPVTVAIMADAEVATKAPENDAQEISGIPGDSKPDQGPASMGVGRNSTH